MFHRRTVHAGILCTTAVCGFSAAAGAQDQSTTLLSPAPIAGIATPARSRACRSTRRRPTAARRS